MRCPPVRLAAAVAALTVAASGCRGSVAAPDATAPGVLEPNASIVRVVDGDTIVVRIGGGEERVRLIGIDTPESVAEDTPVECWALEASAIATDLLPAGTPVQLERDVEARDRYDRLLAYVRRASDGLFVNLELARLGAAAALAIEPNTAYETAMDSAVAEARTEARGLWGACGGPHEAAP